MVRQLKNWRICSVCLLLTTVRFEATPSITVVTDQHATVYAVDNGLDLKLGEKKKKKKKKPAMEVRTFRMPPFAST